MRRIHGFYLPPGALDIASGTSRFGRPPVALPSGVSPSVHDVVLDTRVRPRLRRLGYHTKGATVTALAGVSPNPARTGGRATVAFTTAAAGPVALTVLDVLGREVTRLVAGPMDAGAHTVIFDAAALLAPAPHARRSPALSPHRRCRLP